ncbi:MAG: pirin family protein [Rhodanobacteraceae bacterium]|nr:pirin family protein [Rhodanobacteraceae bacterium]MBK7044110.1 pirin family protein [Rhodanobacteraceae bacterium]MBP9155220.1 pirin family protein [Xanthomonadales bacterium]HQW80890.1 pirin family protein [Pseudomonadota bacterium]
MNSSESRVRDIAHWFPGRAAEDGAGVKLTRLLDPQHARQADPFLMLDEFRSDQAQDYIAGFPSHPHRGFETVTYMIDGRMRHRDNQGNQGDLGPGSVQWMTAARGIVHEEMPQQENGMLWGYQLWINLPSAMKMDPPGYQDIEAEGIPEVQLDSGVRVRVIAGRFDDTVGPVADRPTEPHYFDVQLPRGARFEWATPVGHTVFVQGVSGRTQVGNEGRALAERELVLLGTGERIALVAEDDARVLILTGKPIGEPIAAYGPFVMNTPTEIRQAFDDFRSGRF